MVMVLKREKSDANRQGLWEMIRLDWVIRVDPHDANPGGFIKAYMKMDRHA